MYYNLYIYTIGVYILLLLLLHLIYVLGIGPLCIFYVTFGIHLYTHSPTFIHIHFTYIQTSSGPASSAYITHAVEHIINIHRLDEEGHILVFVTGQEEVERACTLLKQTLQQDNIEESIGRALIILPLYSALTADKQKLVFKKVDKLLLTQPTSTTTSSSTSSHTSSSASAHTSPVMKKSPRKW